MNKAYILQEIKRTANANSGAPLGWRKFFSETGIKESDWLGVYWARWSEAIREAGFAPNQLQGPYAESELLAKYAGLARELGKLPTKGDLRLKARSDPKFPSDKTFARLGTMAEFVARLRVYCHTAGHEDVARLCGEYVPRKRHAAKEEASGEDFGSVYLLKSGRFYKIGRSNACGRRERELAIQLPERASIIHEIRTDDAVGIEAYWHKRFEPQRKNGEWFDLDTSHIKAFKRRKFM